MRVMVTGAHGLLGQAVLKLFLKSTNSEILATAKEPRTFLDFGGFDYTMLDITSRSDVKNLVVYFRPDVIINTAAYTNVDGCEQNRELAWRVNVEGVRNLVHSARRVDAKLIHISTDYIFDGKNGPYTEEAIPNPINYYGRTKLASENEIKIGGIRFAILRTNVLYGVGKNVKSNFALWLYEKLSKGEKIKVVTDQVGNPTYVDDLAFAILKVVEFDKEGVYNIGGRDFVDRYTFAIKLAEIFGFDKELITPVKTSELNQIAPRPLKSGLITFKAEAELGFKPYGVEDGISEFKARLEEV
ncbi:dTDP-4-dehydrorhamnose reductase [Candidatus Kryptonium thompsonii]|uniref:dTDP-4-dehydrorhamnose reductase n=3 Tax=Candidatus Kryptonium thompsonii TaxID=1633631 RepID=A0A0P1L5Z6_9BACT|nr:dTDP-4-dehydrorhamnose reductase [Candidatus Kryptonium thompsoni]CUS76431.1 dTDP-4-dehydrorhamnose reductase [Candidatus Kryptonium thompsoni]CUS82948.1 dTDP-4-dehydrorhamnose reductase [Candidatus Kryptonium thompsoni]CUS85749.1 dTDP-4-dehydrorhamnose reductase [Candidatus Kryptonium thompsoni]CUS87581.1 dTDP-4-dehydrorhamnose reductase [Candidatus Kryptonium thompsoni]CUS98758.1 dTDP-4-dehydrorhamnose reductase [Candidatus Kryptonium thompsoni]